MGVDIQTYRAKIGTYRHSCGLDVVTVVHVVNFSHGFKTIGCVLFIGLLLIMAGVEQNPGPKGSDDRQVTELVKTTLIKVTELTENITREVLELFFQEQEFGDVKEVIVDSKENSAIIEFVDTNAVESILHQLPICILGTTVNVQRIDKRIDPDEARVHQEALQSDEDKRIDPDEARVHQEALQSDEAQDTPSVPQKTATIKVSGLPKEATRESLLMFFENVKRQGGGTVADVCIDENEGSALIEFEEEEAVNIVLRKVPIIFSGNEVKAEKFTLGRKSNDPKTQPNVVINKQDQGIGVDEGTKEVRLDLLRKVVVRNSDDPQTQPIVEISKPEQGTSVDKDTKKKELYLQSKALGRKSYDPQTQPNVVISKQDQGIGVDEGTTKIRLALLRKAVVGNSDDPQTQPIVEISKPEQGTSVDKDTKKEELDIQSKDGNSDTPTRKTHSKIDTRRQKQGTSLGGNKDVDQQLYKALGRKSYDPQTQPNVVISKQDQGIGVDEGTTKIRLALLRKAVVGNSDDPQTQPIVEISKPEQGTSVDKDTKKEELDIQSKDGNRDTPTRKTHSKIDTRRQKQGTSLGGNKDVDQQLYKALGRKSYDPQTQPNAVISKQDQGIGVDEGTKKIRLALLRKAVVGNSDDPQTQPIVEISKPEQGTSVDKDTKKEELDIQSKAAVGRKIDDPQTQSNVENNKQEQGTSVDIDVKEEELDTQSKDKKEFEGTLFHQVLSRLGLENKYPSKISIQDVIAVDPNEATLQDKKSVSLVDLPWLMLKRLICAHSECRDMPSSEENITADSMELDHKMSFLFEKPTEKEEISPLDIFNVVYQCCDPLLKQVFFRKLYLCKIAVPFICKHWETKESCHSLIYLWPLRSLTVENSVQSDRILYKIREVDLLQLQTKVVAFARFGRPRYSKSKLLNNLLSNQDCKTFFNIDCPSGMTPRNLINGHVEMFWLPTIGDKNEKFVDAMTFLNMRGNINDKFDLAVLSFIADFVDAVTIITDRESILKKRKEATAVLTHFSSVILIIADPLRPADEEAIHNFQSEVLASNPHAKLRLLSTHLGNSERNVIDMVKFISTHINSHLKNKNTRSLQLRLECLKKHKIKTDEQDNNCQEGKNEADDLFKQMNLDGESSCWKKQLTPVHSKYSQQLGKLIKIREREKDFTEGDNIDANIKDVRRKQTQSITKTVRMFIQILMRNETSPLKLNLFLGWLHFYIEREKRKILPELMYENRCAWEKLKTLKNRYSNKPSEIVNQESNITQIEAKLNEASFSVEHFFREIGHIYDAIFELKLNSSTFALPPLDRIANIIGKLVSDGYQLELIDGESFYMPYSWTKNVLKQVDKIMDASKVMILSVLGLQSSGKSTLLNTMFGSQFSTRTGRCTRGIHVQLIPVRSFGCKQLLSTYKYVLVVDTEGLRSPELSHVQHEHDNELATVITGIGDITMLNIMGENTSEIRDILQVIVHAFLRLKMTNRKLDMRKSCAFVHQNVTETSASENMLSGLTKLVQTLDEMTKESARSEGMLDINTFNQVIEFDINSHVWYLKNLWQGNPPMARVNNEYCENVVAMKCKVLENAVKMKNKSYKSLADIIEHTHSLWKGVLNEDFVFSFRNSLEIRVYMQMEKVVQDELWRLESFIRERIITTKNRFSGCDQRVNLREIATEIIDHLNDLLAVEKVETIKIINTHFDTNKYKDIIEQWKNSQKVRIDNLCGQLEYSIREHIEKSLALRSVEILTVSSHKKHEEELNRKSMEVAKQNAGLTLTEVQIDNLFATIWQSFIVKLDTSSCTSEQNRKNMRQIFEKTLKNVFKEHRPMLGESASKLLPIPVLKQLGGSFALDDEIINCISFTKWENFKRYWNCGKVKSHITERVNQIFRDIDCQLNKICQVNDEITEMTVNKLMHELVESVRGILTGQTGFDFKPPFYIYICVHFSRFAHPIFEKHNDNYFKTAGIAARLNQYKEQQKIIFVAHLNNRQSEDIAATLFSNVIETFAEEWTLNSLTNKVADNLYSVLPSLKNIAIMKICTDLLEQGDFESFNRYLQTPKEYSTKWITEQANMYLFDEGYYTALANQFLNELFMNVKDCIRKLKKSAKFMEEWINDFQEEMAKKDYSIPPESFRNVKKEIEEIKNIEYLTDVILDHLLKSEALVKCKFRQCTSQSVKWASTNPLDRIIKKIWGCSKQCAFCGEPCAKNDDHDGSLHYSLQHRPSCCIGTRNRNTKDASLESCNFNIQSDSSHNCPAFGYSCNNETRKKCSKEWHPYRDYKSFLPDWDIAPTSQMHDTSKFWMWFVATYKNELHDYHDYNVDKIPSSWHEITKEEAKMSLRKTYTV